MQMSRGETRQRLEEFTGTYRAMQSEIEQGTQANAPR